MDRRIFIKTGVFVPFAAATTLSAACTTSSGPRRAGPRVVAPAPPPAVVQTLGGLHALDFLSDFVGRTSSSVTSDRIDEWLTTRAEAERSEIQGLNLGMAEKGFSDYRDPRVFANGNAIFYGVANVDGRNACAPFWVDGQKAALVEGPAIVGLSLAARDWTDPAGVTAAQGLLPIGTIHRDQGAQFGVSFPYPYVYQTAVGQVALNYQLGSRSGGERLSIVAERGDGSLLLRQDYELRDG